MYAWIWRKLPFGLPGKLAGSVLLTTATVALLWYVVFPWAEPLLPFDDVQVSQETGDPGDPGVPGFPPAGDGPAPTEDGHDLPYDTDENNPPPSPEE
ncbi:hypothetical protein [Salinispora fenicalii]|uniref:hypothetical protein n=1 Tax=Salinispora fenicalii TaxID=1137263 RepID=UPI00036E56C5|nr:hypothetical protein [Salinispora fenicalii]